MKLLRCIFHIFSQTTVKHKEHIYPTIIRFGYKIILVHKARLSCSKAELLQEFSKAFPGMNDLATKLKNEDYENQVFLVIVLKLCSLTH